MTQYLISVIHPEAGPEWDEDVDMQEVMAKVDAFNTELQTSGSWVFAGGLEPPSSAKVVDATGSETLVIDGPWAETKEQLGGFWVVEAADLDAALEIGKRGSAACMGAVEVRPFQAEPPAE
jgi:hypothetical protein